MSEPRRSGFYVQQHLLDRLYADPSFDAAVLPELSSFSAQAWLRCSPSLAGFRGLRDPAVAEALGYTLHYGYDPCLIADSCDNQRDAITNLTRAMSDRFRVEYHGVTSTAKGFDDFVQEVPIRQRLYTVCETAV